MGFKDKLDGDLDNKRDVGRKDWQGRMHGVDKMDTEGNSQEGKLEIWKVEGSGWCGAEG